jgi:ABC-type oligopeptide transport system substrate-binding subunit
MWFANSAGNSRIHLIGSGPYRLAERRARHMWRMERNPYYTGPDGFVDGIEVMIGPDRTTIAMMIERGVKWTSLSPKHLPQPRSQRNLAVTLLARWI